MIVGLIAIGVLVSLLGVGRMTRKFMEDIPIHRDFDELWFEN